MRIFIALVTTAALTNACQIHQGESCERDSNCAAELVCEQKICVAGSVRKANAASAEVTLRRAARDLVASKLQMGDDVTSRLTTTIFPHSVLVRDPGKICFLVRRDNDGTLSLVRRTSSISDSHSLPGPLSKSVDDIPWSQQGKKNGVCDEPAW